MPIFYVNAPSFAVAVERLREPACAVSLAVAAHISPRPRSSLFLLRPHALGIRPGLKVAEARRLECHLKIVPPILPL
jgi:hypothetical protein